MHRKLTMLIVALALVVTSVLAPAGSAFVSSAQAAPPDRGELLTDIPITQSLPGGGTLEGVLSITELTLNEDGDLLVSGVIDYTSGTYSDTQEFTALAATLTNDDPDACDILFLDLGPLFLDVLGLTVDLSQIVLDIDAVRGPGRLLGNLLCAVVGLLDGSGPLGQITRLLDRINDLLG